LAGESAAPCNHPGAPPEEVIDLVANAVRAIAEDAAFLQRQGLTKQDFELALPAAIQRIRGSAAADNSDRRLFLKELLQHLVDLGTIRSFETPEYGDDTVYRLFVDGIGSIAIVQKGCPDGVHSSVTWSSPDWADETYLWWLCDSLTNSPGEHVSKGVNRLRNRFFSHEYSDSVDGVIFHNATCGTPLRPCPKIMRALTIGEKRIPPPCVWIMPERMNLTNETDTEKNWNWEGRQVKRFPAVLLSAFGIDGHEARHFTGHIGFLKGARGTRTTISSRYGAGASTTYRSVPR
jgi:hypothetical protein